MQSHNAGPIIKNRVSVGLSEAELREALRAIFQHYGYDLADLKVEAKKVIAQHLSDVARRGDDPWGWRYIHNVYAGNQQASRELSAAIMGLVATIDGMPMTIVQGRAVSVTALAEIRPGALVFVASRKCARLECPIHFVPRVHNHKYCTPACNPRSRRSAQKRGGV